MKLVFSVLLILLTIGQFCLFSVSPLSFGFYMISFLMVFFGFADIKNKTLLKRIVISANCFSIVAVILILCVFSKSGNLKDIILNFEKDIL